MVDYEGWTFLVPRPEYVDGWLYREDIGGQGYEAPATHLRLTVAAYDRDQGIIRISQYATLERLIQENRAVGEVFIGRVTGVRQHGAFVSISRGHAGRVAAAEMAWDRSNKIDPGALCRVGQQVAVTVLSTSGRHHESGRSLIDLSMRRVDWTAVRSTLAEGAVTPALAFEIRDDEVLFQLPGPALGRAHRREVVGHRSGEGYLSDVITEGDLVPVRVLNVQDDLMRFDVSYREARTETSATGSWKFDQRGRVLAMPDEAKTAFPEAARALTSRLRTRSEAAGLT